MANNQVFVVVIEIPQQMNTATCHCSAAGYIVSLNASSGGAMTGKCVYRLVIHSVKKKQTNKRLISIVDIFYS